MKNGVIYLALGGGIPLWLDATTSPAVLIEGLRCRDVRRVGARSCPAGSGHPSGLGASRVASGRERTRLAVTVRLSPQAVRNIAARYRRTGLEHALYERRRPGAAEVLGTPDKQRIIAMVCTDQPTGAARWTVRLIAEQVVKRELVPHVGRETIRAPLQRHDLKPWREKMWCLADLDAAYIANMEDPLALYESPYRAEEPVICLDEKPVSLYAEVRTPRPARPGHVAKRDRDYRRGGTANRTSAAFARMVGTAIAAYPAARTMHCVMAPSIRIGSRRSPTTMGSRRATVCGTA